MHSGTIPKELSCFELKFTERDNSQSESIFSPLIHNLCTTPDNQSVFRWFHCFFFIYIFFLNLKVNFLYTLISTDVLIYYTILLGKCKIFTVIIRNKIINLPLSLSAHAMFMSKSSHIQNICILYRRDLFINHLHTLHYLTIIHNFLHFHKNVLKCDAFSCNVQTPYNLMFHLHFMFLILQV